MHSYFTRVWFLKFGIATVGAGIAAWNDQWVWAIVFFIGAIVTVTIVANVLYGMIGRVNPQLIRRWEIDSSRRLLFAYEPEEVSRRLASIDFGEESDAEARDNVSSKGDKRGVVQKEVAVSGGHALEQVDTFGDSVLAQDRDGELRYFRNVVTSGYRFLQTVAVEFPDVPINRVRVPAVMNVTVDVLAGLTRAGHLNGHEMHRLMSVVRPIHDEMEERQLDFLNSDDAQGFEHFYETQLFDEIEQLRWLQWRRPKADN